MKYIGTYQSPLGPVTLASDGEALTGLWFDGSRYDRQGLSKEPETKDLPVFEETRRWLDLYFEGKDPGFTPALKITGSDFRRLVCEIMLEIPFGCLMTYGDIAKEAAKRLGKPAMSAQAVGGAVGHNPLTIIVPCHRVVGTGGSLTGYGGGMDRKIYLLKNEGIDLEKQGLYRPQKGTAL